MKENSKNYKDNKNDITKNKKPLKKNKGKNIFLGTSLLALVLLMVIVGQIQTSSDPEYTFNNGTYINGEQVGGYSVERASKVVTDKMQQQIDGIKVQIVYKDKVWQLDEDDFELTNSVQKVVQDAFIKLNRDSTINNINKNSKRQVLQALKGGNIKISLKNTVKNFDEIIDNIVNEIEEEPENAKVIFKPKAEQMFTINEAKSGIKVDREKLVNDLENQFLKTKDIKVFVSTTPVKAEIDKSYYDNKLNLMSKFETDLKNSQEGRRFNVGYALEKFNGMVVKKGEQISFNEITGPQTKEGGYKPAVVIMNGKFVTGIGGGLCQASTTLYNACVLANLQIDEVHKHTLPVGYVELSLDAMVSDGYADFIFTNNSEDDIYIKSQVVGDKAQVEIYGNSIPEGYTVKRVAEFIGNIPHNGDKIIIDEKGEYSDKVLYKGEYFRLTYPREGYEAKAFKETYKDGKLIDREEIRHEKYQPVDGKIVEGAKVPPEGYVIPKTDVEFIKPEKRENTSVETMVKQVKKNNPTQFNL